MPGNSLDHAKDGTKFLANFGVVVATSIAMNCSPNIGISSLKKVSRKSGKGDRSVSYKRNQHMREEAHFNH